MRRITLWRTRPNIRCSSRATSGTRNDTGVCVAGEIGAVGVEDVGPVGGNVGVDHEVEEVAGEGRVKSENWLGLEVGDWEEDPAVGVGDGVFWVGYGEVGEGGEGWVDGRWPVGWEDLPQSDGKDSESGEELHNDGSVVLL